MHRLAFLVAALSILLAGCGEPTSDDPATDTILMVVTSADAVDADHPTGLWLEEFEVPFQKFKAAGYDVVVASPKGGKAPIDPASTKDAAPEAETTAALADTRKLADVDLDGYVAVFFPGGHGTMFDLPDDATVKKTVSHFIENDQPAAFVCHGPAALVGATLSDGTPVVQGRKVTGFTDSEEKAVKLDEKMPFLLETRLKELGGEFAGAADWQAHVVVDGNLITGQNPASSGEAADALIAQLKKAK